MIAFVYELLRTSRDGSVTEWCAHRREVPDGTAESETARVVCDVHGKEFVVTHGGVGLPCCETSQ